MWSKSSLGPGTRMVKLRQLPASKTVWVPMSLMSLGTQPKGTVKGGGRLSQASPGRVVEGGRDVFVSRWNKRENISQRLRRKEHHLQLRNLCSLLLGDIMFNQLGSKKNGCDWKMILKPFWGRSFFGAKLVKLQGVVYVSCLEGTGLKE